MALSYQEKQKAEVNRFLDALRFGPEDWMCVLVLSDKWF